MVLRVYLRVFYGFLGFFISTKASICICDLMEQHLLEVLNSNEAFIVFRSTAGIISVLARV